jgi:beta-lactamase superfamily II metal-dependent hydrolase
MSDLLRSTAPEFLWLVTGGGFTISESVVKLEEFGNASLVLESVAFKVRIYTDRVQRFVDVGRDGRSWHKLEYVLEFLEPSCSQAWFGEPPQLDKLSVVLKRNMQPVSRLLTGDLAASGFSMFEKKKSADLVDRIFGEKS